MISYQKKKSIHKVYVNAKAVGEIRPVNGGYRYFKKGSLTGGKRFDSVSNVKKSLELRDGSL